MTKSELIEVLEEQIKEASIDAEYSMEDYDLGYSIGLRQALVTIVEGLDG